jgi:hypothetical protein
VEYRPAGSPRIGSYLAWLVLGAAVLAAIAIYGAGRFGPMTGTNSAQTSAPRPHEIPDRADAANARSQPSPQGPTGPISTTSGGAPAASPQGETPAGMQTVPQGSPEKKVTPPK